MNFDGQKICGVLDHLGDASCLWPLDDFSNVTIYADGKLGQVELPDAMNEAIAAWNEVCGINLVHTTNRKTAHIVVAVGHIDGPGGVLGHSGLPCGFRRNNWRPLDQMYDSGDVWTISENPPQGRIDAVRVCRHEVGHAIGIGHISDGNLMAPTYSSRIRGLQRGDVAEARSRYGLARVAPTPTPTPTPGPTPAPVPGVPDGAGVWSKLLPCLLEYGIDLARQLTPEERASLISVGLNLWRGLGPKERETLRMLTAAQDETSS